MPVGIQSAVEQMLARDNWEWIHASFSESHKLLADAMAICVDKLPPQATIIGEPSFGLFCVVDLSAYVDRLRDKIRKLKT